MSLQNHTAIRITNLTKVYKLYADPKDRLKEALNPYRKKYHKEFYALDNINLEIKEGETLGIIGKNGAGKSTLLKILTGVLTQTSGSIKINGMVSALLELGAGFNPELSGYDNLYFNGMIMGYSREEMREKEEGILAFADIGDYVHQPVKTYSSGMFARLAFAVAVNVDPDILIVDEVLSVGDMRFQQKSIRKMNEFREKGKTILFVTHDTGVVNKFCTRAVWLDQGRILKQGETDSVTKHYMAFMVYGQDSSSGSTNKNRASDPKDETFKWVDTSSCDSFGEGDAKIYKVALCNGNEENTSIVEQGQESVFYAGVKVFKDLYDVAVGITIRDRLGNNIFTINSYLYDAPIGKLEAGYDGVVRMAFQFPKLAVGKYSISVAIAEGTQMTHVQQNWVHDVVFFDVISPDGLDGTGCMIAIPPETVTFSYKRMPLAM
jgi:ABC-type polysaccharide/polyol phosphate transport system ATPase subunit